MLNLPEVRDVEVTYMMKYMNGFVIHNQADIAHAIEFLYKGFITKSITINSEVIYVVRKSGVYADFAENVGFKYDDLIMTLSLKNMFINSLGMIIGDIAMIDLNGDYENYLVDKESTFGFDVSDIVSEWKTAEV